VGTETILPNSTLGIGEENAIVAQLGPLAHRRINREVMKKT
jgi:hypothetical protein